MASLDYNTKQKVAANMEANRQPEDTATQTLTSLALLRDMFQVGDPIRNNVEELMRAEASTLLGGVAALMKGPNAGILREQFGTSLESASYIGKLLRQQQSENTYRDIMSGALNPEQKKKLGLDIPAERRERFRNLIGK